MEEDMKVLSREELRRDKGVTYSDAQLLRKERDGSFPKRIRLGENRIGWVEGEIDRWIEGRIRERDGAAEPAGAA